MKKISLKMVAMTAAMMMCLTADANRWSSEDRAMLASDMSSRDRGRAVLKTEDVGGRVIDMQGEPLPFNNKNRHNYWVVRRKLNISLTTPSQQTAFEK